MESRGDAGVYFTSELNDEKTAPIRRVSNLRMLPSCANERKEHQIERRQ